MCFVSDYDWYSSVQDEEKRTTEKDIRCDECWTTIKAGEVYHWLYQQEHEECTDCENGYCSCPKDDDGDCKGGCSCDLPNYGETFTYESCLNCWKFLEAVSKAEVKAGCEAYESRPALTQMIEDIREGGMDEAKKYFNEAAETYPELAKSGYLGELWKTIFRLD